MKISQITGEGDFIDWLDKWAEKKYPEIILSYKKNTKKNGKTTHNTK